MVQSTPSLSGMATTQSNAFLQSLACILLFWLFSYDFLSLKPSIQSRWCLGSLVLRLKFWDCLHPLEDLLLLWLPLAFFELFRQAFPHGFQRTLRGVHPFTCVQRKGRLLHPGSLQLAPCCVVGCVIGTGAAGEGAFIHYRSNTIV